MNRTNLESAAKSALGTLPELPLFEGIMEKLFVRPMASKTNVVKDFVESSKPPETFKTLEDFHAAFVDEMKTCMETASVSYPIRRDDWDLVEMATCALIQAQKKQPLRDAVLQTMENVFDYTSYAEYMNTVRQETTEKTTTEPKRESKIILALYEQLEIDERFTPKAAPTDGNEGNDAKITTMIIEVKIPVAEIPSPTTADRRSELYTRIIGTLARNRPDLRLNRDMGNFPYCINIIKPTEGRPYYTLSISRDIMAPLKDVERTRKYRKHAAKTRYVAAAITKETIRFVAATIAAQEYGNERYEAFMKKVTRAIQVTRNPEMLDDKPAAPAIPTIAAATQRHAAETIASTPTIAHASNIATASARAAI